MSTMPGKGVVIDIPQIEGGTSVLAGTTNIDVLPVVRWDELDDVWKYLQGGTHEYKWVAIDTITACQTLAMRKAVSERDLAADVHLVTQQDWGKIGLLMSELFYRFRLLKISTILLAQEKMRGGEGEREYAPAVSPMALDALLPPQHLVARLYVWQTEDAEGNMVWERRLRTAPHPLYLTKVRNVRGRELAPVLKNPSLGRVLAYMMGMKVHAPEEAKDETAISLDLE